MWDYTKSVIDHFTNPRNVGEIPDANGIGQVGSLACGDALKLFLKIDPHTKVILDAKFKTFGCASAIASASALTELVKGKSIEEAATITNDDIATFLGGLPEQKMHCSVMGREALDSAIANFQGQKESAPHEEESPVICKCFWVTEAKIREAVRENHLTSVEQITNYTKAGGGCGGCRGDLEAILSSEALAQRPIAAPPAAPTGMTNLKRMALITKVLEEQVAPKLRADGGNIELVDIDGLTVLVRLQGACAHCAGAKATLQLLVEKSLQEAVDPAIRVQEVR